MSERDENGEQDDRAGDDDNEASSGVARARKLGKRYAMLVFVGFAAAFIVLSTWEIVAGVFSLDAPGGVAAHGKLSDGCAAQLRAFAAIIDRTNAPVAVNAAEHAEIGSIEAANNGALDSACTSSADLDALAAARRYERAVATSASSASSATSTTSISLGSATNGPRAIGATRAEAIAPLRHDVEAYLAR